jgi:hypothetical protein
MLPINVVIIYFLVKLEESDERSSITLATHAACFQTIGVYRVRLCFFVAAVFAVIIFQIF